MKVEEQAIFDLISHVGSARSSLMEGLYAARENRMEEAELKIAEAVTLLNNGHKVHTAFITQEAAGSKIEFSLLLMHAEDLMLTTETLKEMVTEMVVMYKRIHHLSIHGQN
ncbi:MULTISPECIES: PTS lactose/cellobiose transporter subunit IIA [Virgibacillus]|uniref:Oligo-beta-mannoside-specific phosphotransferase enzyme IIA component n=1 Tax=Virgibacillus massiliensis TaxID=1462526 RepID=A0A024Q925_9BACI|nr:MULTISPECIES: PTS lactose/cellobiose transporter subunit IIA [Virgibacillus]EQB37681.1 hypothetical protein M948_03760 [Virgibacillus sp. CM-4]MYL40420.1 PTS lactose/cellobiose transporter subunit IIA [Virgibacillus massiliensis]CDQ38792.1 Oligo-beta-mannoside-specific phosphotransferase enzyme IIA component [Virgibacillus massiliensis]